MSQQVARPASTTSAPRRRRSIFRFQFFDRSYRPFRVK